MTVTFVLVTFSATSMYRVSGSSVDLILSASKKTWACGTVGTVPTALATSEAATSYPSRETQNKLSDEVAWAGLWWWLVGKNQ